MKSHTKVQQLFCLVHFSLMKTPHDFDLCISTSKLQIYISIYDTDAVTFLLNETLNVKLED